jgi:AraC-like DNA-binding protein
VVKQRTGDQEQPVHARIFNLHDVILLMTVALAVLVALPMLYRRRGQSDLLLASFVVSQGLIALFYLLLYAEPFRPATLELLAPFQILPLLVLYTLQGLLLYGYSYSMGGEAIRLRRIDLTLIAYLWLMPLAVLSWAWLKGSRYNADDGIMLAFPALIASIVYGILAWRTLARHDQRIREQYSNIDDKNLIWLSYSAVGFVAIWILRTLSYLSGVSGSFYWANTIATLANIPAMILIAWMVVLGLSQAASPAREEENEESGRGTAKPVNDEYVRRLEDLMTRVKVYQDPELNREGLADSVGISPRSLTTLVNQHFGMTFYEFVNHYRVLETKAKLADPAFADVTVQRIFEDAGFNSKSTFNTFFKKATGKTPSEFRRFAQVSEEAG